MPNSTYGSRPNHTELFAVIVAGLGHILIELNSSLLVARYYNLAVSIVFLAYLVWRIRRSPEALRVWGFRIDNLGVAAVAQSKFLMIGIIFLIGFALVSNSPGLPRTFWLTIALYPI